MLTREPRPAPSPTRRAAILLLVVCVGVSLLAFLPRAAAQDDAPPDAVAPLRLLTFNILYKNADIEALAGVILDADADLVLAQEVGALAAADLPPALTDAYPYSAIYRGERERLGLAVFSRLPLLAQDYQPFAEQSSLLRVEVDYAGQPLAIYNVHLANPLRGDRYDATTRGAAITALLDRLGGETAPLVVAGDFNLTELDADYARLTGVLVDSFRESGGGFGATFPVWSPLPFARLDYVFHSADLISRSAEVVATSGGSDHFPVRVELAPAP